MRTTSFLPAVAILSWPALAAAEPSPLAPQVGRVYEIRTTVSSQQTGPGASGDSNGREVLTERVVAMRGGTLDLEYDIPDQASGKVKDWRFPVLVRRSKDGRLDIVNRPELDARLNRWLAAANLTKAVCGRWTFTWTAHRFECDAGSVLDVIRRSDLVSAETRPGSLYRPERARAPVPLQLKTSGPDGSTLVAEAEIDPGSVRRERAEQDVAVAQILRTTLTPEEARKRRAGESISGRVSATFDTDAAGYVRRRTVTTTLSIAPQDGREAERLVSTETVERRLLP